MSTGDEKSLAHLAAQRATELQTNGGGEGAALSGGKGEFVLERPAGGHCLLLQATGSLSPLSSATAAQKSHGQPTSGRGRVPIKPPPWALRTGFRVISVAPNTVLLLMSSFSTT